MVERERRERERVCPGPACRPSVIRAGEGVFSCLVALILRHFVSIVVFVLSPLITGQHTLEGGREGETTHCRSLSSSFKMDADLWSSRLAAAKRHHALQQSQHYQWDRLSADDFEVEDEVRPEFVCPYCYEDFEISALCSHLEEEHMYESKGVACPVCAVKITKDVVGHMTYQHAHLFKVQRRRRYRRSGVPAGSSFSLLGKELREAHLQVLLGGVAFGNNSGTSSTNTTDSLLSTLAYSFPTSECEDLAKQSRCIDDTLVLASSKQHKLTLETSLSAEEREQKLKRATLQAKFAQQLVLSTILGDNH